MYCNMTIQCYVNRHKLNCPDWLNLKKQYLNPLSLYKRKKDEGKEERKMKSSWSKPIVVVVK